MMKSISATIDEPKINGWIRPSEAGGQRFDKFLKQFASYCENSSLNGCRYFTEPARPSIERLIWILVYIVMIGGTCFVVLDVYDEYKRSPIVTTEDKDLYPLNQLPFPALALCTLNRISYTSARELATKIHASNVSRMSFDDILDSLKYLGNMYDYSNEPFESEHKLLHNLLTQFYSGEYDLNDIMKSLTPKCSDVLLACNYASERVSCMNIFTFRKTQDGYCCTFNYVRQSDEFIPASRYNRSEHQSRALRPVGPGVANGLSILIEPLLHDYFYTIPTGRGWKVIIFNAEDYPDYPSGGVMEQTIAPSTETYLTLDAIAFSTRDDIISYPVDKRGCIFNSELKKVFTGYTYSDCIVNCRVEDIWQTCNCIPFFFPKRDNRRTCDLTDIVCLIQNKSKWWVLFPHESSEDDNTATTNRFHTASHGSNEHASFLDCSECYPQCNDVRYFVRSSVASLNPGLIVEDLALNVTVKEQSIVHVFFAREGVTRLQQDVMYYWYELLSNIGGICGVFVGFSLISIAELLFFLVSPFFTGARENVRKSLPLKLEEQRQKDVTPVNPEIYWAELHPRRQQRRFNKRKSVDVHRTHQ